MNERSVDRVYKDIALGDTASFALQITEKLVDEFASLTGDRNPLHTDVAYARETYFGHRIAHGMLIGAFFSRLIGMHLPGTYALYLTQTLRFHRPVVLGTHVAVRGEVVHKSDAQMILTIKTAAVENVTGKVIVEGEATVQMLQ